MELKELLEIQEKINNHIETELSEEEIITRLLLALYTEVGEFSNEVQSFKYWKKNKNVDKEKVIFELVDIFKICGSIAIKLGFTSEDIEKAIILKSKIVEERNSNAY